MLDVDPDHVAHFWSQVDRSGGPDACWPWTGGLFGEGYGNAWAIPGIPCRPASGRITSHRLAWILTYGDPGTHVAPSGRVITNRVRHRCPGGPNRLCSNPAHLRTGSDKANADDRADDGNTFRGEQVGIHKLTEAAVREALLAHAAGESIDSLAERFGVHRGTMVPALNGDTWAHVSPEIQRRDRRSHAGAPPKLTAEAVLQMRADREAGRTYSQLSADYGVAVGTVQAIVSRRTWRHI
jgi:hypothetical protein